MPGEQGIAVHDHARGAVAALQRTGIEKGLLQRMQLALVLEPFDRSDRLFGTLGECHPARANGPAVQHDRARAALPLAAAILAAGQSQFVAEHAEQHSLGLCRDVVPDSIHTEFNFAHRGISQRTGMRRRL